MVGRWRAALVAALAVALLAAGCGGEGERRAGYCAELQADQQKFSSMFETEDPVALLQNLALLRRVADKAPEDLQDEWQTLLNALTGLKDALDEAGVEPSQYRGGRPPAGLSVAKQKAISDAADTLASQEVLASANGIDQQARDVCRIQLGL